MNKPIAPAAKIFSLLGSNAVRGIQTTAVSFFSPENLSPRPTPLGNICHGQTIWEWIFFLFLLQAAFFLPAPFLFLAAHEEKAGWVGGEGNTPPSVAPWVITPLISSSQPQTAESVLTSSFGAPAVWCKEGAPPPPLDFSLLGAIW